MSRGGVLLKSVASGVQFRAWNLNSKNEAIFQIYLFPGTTVLDCLR